MCDHSDGVVLIYLKTTTAKTKKQSKIISQKTNKLTTTTNKQTNENTKPSHIWILDVKLLLSSLQYNHYETVLCSQPAATIAFLSRTSVM